MERIRAYPNAGVPVRFTISRFTSCRPYAYHLTSSTNLASIRDSGHIHSASALMSFAQRLDLLRYRRLNHVSLRVGNFEARLRDQAPLHAANIKFADGWQLENLVEVLNNLVFFWPGTARGPNDFGVRHYGRYKDEHPVILRVLTSELLKQNPKTTPLFCRFNSGSLRFVGGRPSPRGLNRFVNADRFDGTPSDVVQLVFIKSVHCRTTWSGGRPHRAPGRARNFFSRPLSRPYHLSGGLPECFNRFSPRLCAESTF